MSVNRSVSPCPLSSCGLLTGLSGSASFTHSVTVGSKGEYKEN